MKYADNFLIRALFGIPLIFLRGDATRFLPMIVWDHLNPQLSCKCNWLTIPSIDVYDRLDFMCPSLKVAVKLLDGHSRPTSEMNENIFQRKWDQSIPLDQLEGVLHSGTFCNRSEAVHLGACKNGEDGKSHAVTFKSSSDVKKNFKEHDIVVFFNNGDDGRQSTLNSNDVKCTMVFVVNITWLQEDIHDLSYGKCFKPPSDVCGNISASCKSQCNQRATCAKPTPNFTSSSQSSPVTSKPSTSSPFTTTKSSPVTSSEGEEEKETTLSATTLKGTTSNKIERAQNSKRKPSDDGFDGKSFGFGVLVGLVFGLLISLVVYLGRKEAKKKGWWCFKLEKTKPCQNYKNSGNPEGKGRVSTDDEEQGFDNKSFEMESPSAPPAFMFSDGKDEKEMGNGQVPCTPLVGHTNRLPSVDTNTSSSNRSKGTASPNDLGKMDHGIDSGSRVALKSQSPLPPISVLPKNSVNNGALPSTSKSSGVSQSEIMKVRRCRQREQKKGRRHSKTKATRG